MESNKRAIRILLMLLISVGVIFAFERKFLVKELRGETISHYGAITWADKITLLVDDFEGISHDSLALQNEHFFGYGNIKISTDSLHSDANPLSSKSVLKVEWDGKETYGGWGKGVGKNMDMNTETDYLNFRIYIPKTEGYDESINIAMEEDDNNDGVLQKEEDDSWFYKLKMAGTDSWHFISVPLKDFEDANTGGDGQLNITRKGGLHTLIFSFDQVEKYAPRQTWYFDFICFTNGKVTDPGSK